jgi:hypothetical protein
LFEFRPIFEDSDLLKTIARMEGVHPPTGGVSQTCLENGARGGRADTAHHAASADHDSFFSYPFVHDFSLRSTPATRTANREVELFQ